jgi:hypothetical protein
MDRIRLRRGEESNPCGKKKGNQQYSRYCGNSATAQKHKNPVPAWPKQGFM